MPLNDHYIHKRQQGSSLLEVMIALFVLAIGLLGFVGLQTEGITMGRQAYMHSQAIFLAQDLIERMRANVNDQTTHNLYTTGFNDTATSTSDCSSTATDNCSSLQLASWDLDQWRGLVAGALPGGAGAVTVTNNAGVTTVVVNIRYQLARGRLNPGETAPSDTASTYTYTLRTQL